MEGASSIETRKAVCRSFANVVKASPLADSIDPKAFFMMLSSNFAVIYRGGKLHLSPVWDVLAQQHQADALVGLFLKFDEAAKQLRIPTVLPEKIRTLPDDVRQLHLMRFSGNDPGQMIHDPSGLTPLLQIESINENIEPLPLTTGDLKPLITDDLKRRVSQAIAGAIRASAMGQRVQPAQVAFMIDSNFEQLCDGRTFDFRAVDAALRDLGDVSDADIYGVVVRLQDALEGSGIEVQLSKLQLDEEQKAAIEQRVRRVDRISDPRIPALHTPAPGPAPKRTATPPGEIAAVARETSKEKKLRRLGLGGPNKYARFVRIGIMTAVLVVIGVVGFLNRPTRALDLDEYNALLPLRHTVLIDGVFQGMLDEAGWDKLTASQRQKAVDALAEKLKSEGILTDAQIRDFRNSVVIASRGPALIASPNILKRNLAEPEGGKKETAGNN